jgi:hypothetical protein
MLRWSGSLRTSGLGSRDAAARLGRSGRIAGRERHLQFPGKLPVLFVLGLPFLFVFRFLIVLFFGHPILQSVSNATRRNQRPRMRNQSGRVSFRQPQGCLTFGTNRSLDMMSGLPLITRSRLKGVEPGTAAPLQSVDFHFKCRRGCFAARIGYRPAIVRVDPYLPALQDGGQNLIRQHPCELGFDPNRSAQ